MKCLNSLKVSPIMRKHAFCICENKGADQRRRNHAVDLRLYFHCIGSTFPLFDKAKFQASNQLQCMYSLVCVGPGRKPQGQVFL